MQEVLNDGGDVGSSLQGYKLGLALFSLQLVAFPVFDCVPQNLLVGLGSAGEVGQPVKIHTNQQWKQCATAKQTERILVAKDSSPDPNTI